METQETNNRYPDYIIPFKLDKEAARAALRNYFRGKVLLPKCFSEKSHIEEIKGIYVPFLLFSGVSSANISCHATKSNTNKAGKDKVTAAGHYRLVRSGNIAFDKVPVDASSNMPAECMDDIEPFDYTALAPFSAEYLQDYQAGQFDGDFEECNKRASDRIRTSTEEYFTGTISGYSDVNIETSDISISQGEIKYAYFPVWTLNTEWKGKSFLFAMNGQTGKRTGNLPVDPIKLLLWFACIAVPLMLILWIALLTPAAAELFIGEAGNITRIAVTIIAPLLIAFLVCMLFRRRMKPAKKQRTAGRYIKEGGVSLTGSNDTLLYNTETRQTGKS